MPESEAQASTKIDQALQASGWAVQRHRDFDPSASRGIALTEVPLQIGAADYLFLVDRKPVGIIEAKKSGTPLSGVAEQSGHYGDTLPDFLAIKGPLPFRDVRSRVYFEQMKGRARVVSETGNQLPSLHYAASIYAAIPKQCTLEIRVRRI